MSPKRNIVILTSSQAAMKSNVVSGDFLQAGAGAHNLIEPLRAAIYTYLLPVLSVIHCFMKIKTYIQNPLPIIFYYFPTSWLMETAPRAVFSNTKQDFAFGAFNQHTEQRLTVELKKKTRHLLSLSDKNRGENLFTEGKISTVNETFSKQNDRMHAVSKLMPGIERGHFLTSVMV